LENKLISNPINTLLSEKVPANSPVIFVPPRNRLQKAAMHPLFLLAIATFVLILGFLAWNLISSRRNQDKSSVSGVGGPSDPLSGNSEGIRKPDELCASLDADAR
jgi:hypothetical protein